MPAGRRLLATRNVHLHGHLNFTSIRRHLRRIREKDTTNGILVVTESLFSMDSDTPDLVALQNLCKEYEATLLVDVAHDLGAMGPGGRGFIGEQGYAGQGRYRHGKFLQDLRVEWRIRLLQFDGGEAIPNTLS